MDARGAEPAADRQGLHRVEVADLAQFQIGALLEERGGSGLAVLAPGERAGGARLRGQAGTLIQGEAPEEALGGDVLLEVGRLQFGHPAVEILLRVGPLVLRGLLGRLNLRRQSLEARAVGLGRQNEDRAAAILDVAVEAGLGRVAEEGCERVEVLGGKRVELMVVALGAISGQA